MYSGKSQDKILDARGLPSGIDNRRIRLLCDACLATSKQPH